MESEKYLENTERSAISERRMEYEAQDLEIE
jgi:hypothetical protein